MIRENAKFLTSKPKPKPRFAKRRAYLHGITALGCLWTSSLGVSNESKLAASDRCVMALRIVLENKVVSAFDEDHIKKLASMSEKQLMDIYPTYSIEEIKQLKQVVDMPRLVELRRMQADDYIKKMELDHKDLIPKMESALKLQREQIKRELELTKTLKNHGIIGEKRIPEEAFHKILQNKIDDFLPSIALRRFAKDSSDLFEALHMHLGISAFRYWLNNQGDAVETAIRSLPASRRQDALDFVISAQQLNFINALAYANTRGSLEQVASGGLDLLDYFYKLKIKRSITSNKIADNLNIEVLNVHNSWVKNPHYISHPSKTVQKALPFVLYLRRQLTWQPVPDFRYHNYLIQFDLLADPPRELLKYIDDADKMVEVVRKSGDDEFVRSLLSLKGDNRLSRGAAYQLLLRSYKKISSTLAFIGSALGWYRPIAD